MTLDRPESNPGALACKLSVLPSRPHPQNPWRSQPGDVIHSGTIWPLSNSPIHQRLIVLRPNGILGDEPQPEV